MEIDAVFLVDSWQTYALLIPPTPHTLVLYQRPNSGLRQEHPLVRSLSLVVTVWF